MSLFALNYEQDQWSQSNCKEIFFKNVQFQIKNEFSTTYIGCNLTISQNEKTKIVTPFNNYCKDLIFS